MNTSGEKLISGPDIDQPIPKHHQTIDNVGPNEKSIQGQMRRINQDDAFFLLLPIAFVPSFFQPFLNAANFNN